MTLFGFITNYLEPTAYLVYFLALQLYSRHHKGKYLLALRAYSFLAFAVMLYTSVLVEFSTVDTIWLYNVHAFLTIGFLGLYFRHLFHSRFKRNITTGISGSILLYLFIKNCIFQDFHLFDSIGYSLVSASIVLFVLMYFHQLLENVTDQNIFRNFNFWLASGYLVYFASSFIIFLSYYYFTTKILNSYTPQERSLLTSLWGVHNMLLFVSAFSLLLGSLWITYRRKSVSLL